MIYLQLIESEDDKFKFEKIYKQYRNLMFYVAFNLLGNEQDAEDSVHTAFVKIAENLQNLSEVICPKTKSYVVIVTENKAINMLRQRNRHEVQSLDDLPENFKTLISNIAVYMPIGCSYATIGFGISLCVLIGNSLLLRKLHRKF